MAQTDDVVCDKTSIGGHFSALVDEHRFSPPGRYGYESARACLYALLIAIRPKRVHIPNYICSAIPETLKHAGCMIEKYAVGDDLGPAGNIDIKSGDLIILVNYFGLCEKIISDQLNKIPRELVIVDNSQAYFQPAFDCLANIYSPRKFIPVADGGFIETDVPLLSEKSDEEASLSRFQYLLKRVCNEPESSRQDYLAAEKSLEIPSLREISTLTRSLISAADHELIARRRHENFGALTELARINKLNFRLGAPPLIYPLMVENGRRIRGALIDMRVFTPRYWPSISPRNSFEEKLIKDTVFIPIDHRYENSTMVHVVELIKRII